MTTEDIVPKVRALLSTRLKLGKTAEEISEEAPLFGETGLGFDSIDALELALGLEKEFGVVIADRPTAVRVLASIRTIAEYVQVQGKP
jgi:acyl carrier protein